MTEYSVDEKLGRIEAIIQGLRPSHDAYITQAVGLLRAYAERLAADERVVPVAWCALTLNGQIAYFDGRPMVMIGTVGNELHPVPLFTRPPAQAAQVDEYAAGWRQAARWAERDDLLADIGSPAYERDKASALQAKPSTNSTEVDLHDRIEFALRDAGFGLDEASALAQKATAQPAERAIGELLAVIHGDGGHYLARHGFEKAATDALPKVYALMQKAAQQADR